MAQLGSMWESNLFLIALKNLCKIKKATLPVQYRTCLESHVGLRVCVYGGTRLQLDDIYHWTEIKSNMNSGAGVDTQQDGHLGALAFLPVRLTGDNKQVQHTKDIFMLSGFINPDNCSVCIAVWPEYA